MRKFVQDNTAPATARRPSAIVCDHGTPAALAAVFTHQGVYTSPPAFIDRFQLALWVAVSFSAIGVVAALLAPRRAQHQKAVPAASQPALVLATTPE